MISHPKTRRAIPILPALALLAMLVSGCVPTLGSEPPDEGKGGPTTEPGEHDQPDDAPSPNDEPCAPDDCEQVPRPMIELERPLNFPTTKLGDTAYLRAVIRNIGNAPLHIRTITTEGDPQLTVDPSGAVPRTLLYQETMPIALYYSPSGDTYHSATLIIESDDPDRPRLTTNLRGRAAQPCFEATPQVDFGAVQVGREEERSITLWNCAAAGKVTIKQLALEQDGADLSLLPETLAAELPITLGAGGQRTLTLRLTPSLDRPTPSATLRVDHDAGTKRIPLSAQVFERLCPAAIALVTTDRTIDAPSDTLAVLTGEPFALDASASQPAPQDDAALTYSWRLLNKPAGSTLALGDKTAQRLEGMIPDLPGDYRFELRVAQGSLLGCAPALVTLQAQAP